MAQHNGQHHAAQGGARDHDATGGSAATGKPGNERRHAGVENGAGTHGGQDGLREEELVVLRRQRKKHKTQDVAQGAEPEQPSRPVVVKQTTELKTVAERRLERQNAEKIPFSTPMAPHPDDGHQPSRKGGVQGGGIGGESIQCLRKRP